MWQQVVVYLCVAAAALYLGKYVYDSVGAIVKARSGCGEGCAKCAFAESPQKHAKKGAVSPGGIITLTEVRSVPNRQPKP
jgi:hypothetical protein